MRDSYVEEYLPFLTDSTVREEYINVYGKIRIGKVFEDLDALAGSIAYSHCDDLVHDTPPLIIVTASVDRIDLLTPSFPSTQDIKLSGHVSYVGKSSMEITITVETCLEGSEVAIERSIKDRKSGVWPKELFDKKTTTGSKQIMLAKFTMVARDPVTGKAATINTLALDTDRERELFRYGAGLYFVFGFDNI